MSHFENFSDSLISGRRKAKRLPRVHQSTLEFPRPGIVIATHIDIVHLSRFQL